MYFDNYEFTIQPNSQHEISITWQPHVYGNIRKLIKIEQVDSNIKYDFVILGNCIDSQNKKLQVLFEIFKVLFEIMFNAIYVLGYN